MTAERTRLVSTAARLRETFDRAFAEAPVAAADRPEDFLAVRIGGDPYAIRLADVAALHRDRKIVALPNRAPELLGIAGFRGRMAPVYDLGALLGYAQNPKPTWLVISRGKSPVGLAVEQFEAHARVPRENMFSADQEKNARHHVRGAVRIDQLLHPLIHVASVLEAIAERVNAEGPRKEP